MTEAQAKTVLLTLGRLPIALDLARSFAAGGWRVVVADPFAMHLARMSRAVSRCYTVTPPARDAAAFLRDLTCIVADEDVRLVVPISEETMHVGALHGMLPDGVDVFGVPQADTLALHDKLRFAGLAARAGLAVPESVAADRPGADALAQRGDVVLKPRFSCSGRGVQVVRRGEPLPGGASRAGAMVQAFVPGALCSSFSLARDGQVLATVVYRPVVQSGSVAVCFEHIASAPEIERQVASLVGSVSHTGFIAFDFVEDNAGQPQAIECNPRATSGIHFFSGFALARAVSGDTDAVALRSERLLQESYSCFTATLGATLRGDRVAHHWRSLRRARDITWSSRDPWPFLLMMINTWPLIGRALRRRQTFAEVAALDIEWSGTAKNDGDGGA